MTTRDNYPSVTIVAGEVSHIAGATGHMLRMHDGAIYVHMTPAIAQQWIKVLTTITTKESN